MKTALTILKALGIVLVALILLLLAGVIAVQSPSVQEKLGKRALKVLEGNSDAIITFSEISIRFPEAIVLKDVVITDKAPRVEGADTVATIGLLSAKFSVKGLAGGNGAYISHATIKDASFIYAIEKDSLSKTGSRASFRRVFGLKSKEKDSNGWGNILSANSLDIENFHFLMLNPGREERRALQGRINYPGVVNWSNLDIVVDRLNVRHLRIKDSYVHGTVDSFIFREQVSGLCFNPLSGKVKVGRERVRIDDFRLTEDETDLRLDRFQMDGPIADYDFFEDRIRLYAKFRPGSVISMKTISHFASHLDKMTFKALLEGKMEGYVNDFALDGFRFSELASGVTGTFNGTVMDVVNIDKSLFSLNVKNLSFTLDGISRFVKSFSPRTKMNLSGIAKGERFTFKGTAKGPLNRLAVKGKFNSKVGGVDAAVTLRNTVDGKRPFIVGGNIKTWDLDLGSILNSDSLGPLTLDTGLEATLAKDDTKVRIDSLRISRLSAMGYDYTNISAGGTYSGNAFDGRITALDPNLYFQFQGIFNLSPRTNNALYRFYANLAYADLHALHLDSRVTSKIQFYANSNFWKTESGELLGDIIVNDLTLDSDTGHHDIGNISIRSHSNDDTNRIQIQSNFLDGWFVGEKSIMAFANDIRNLTVDKHLPSLSTKHADAWDGTTYDLGFKVLKAKEILNFFAPGVYIADGSAFSLRVGRDGIVKGSASSELLAYSGKYLRDLNLVLDNTSKEVFANVESSAMFISGAELRNNTLMLTAQDDKFGLGYTFDNDTDKETRAEVYLSGNLSRDRHGLQITAKAFPSNLYYNGNGWGLSSGDIVMKGGDFKIHRLLATHDAESVCVDGGFSMHKKDTLKVSLDKFDLSMLDSFTGANPALEGKATGQALILSPVSPTPGLLASIVCDNTKVDGRNAGTLNLESHWNESTQAFDFSVFNRMEAITNLSLDGFLKPSTREISARAKLLRLDLGYTYFLLDNIFSTLEGALSGEINVGGKLDDIRLSSRGLHLDDGIMEPDFTRVPYSVSGNLSMDEFGLHFDDMELTDNIGGTGTLGGSVLWGGFKNMGLDTHVSFDKMHVISLDRGMNSTLYGDVYATGKVDIIGPMNAINMDVDATTSREGNVHIPISSSGAGRSTQLLTFVEPKVEENLELMEIMSGNSKTTAKKSSSFNIHLNITATPDVALFIELADDYSINGSGSGTIQLDNIPSQGILTMNGDYTFTQGNFHFSAMGLVSRDFTIEDGSTVRLNGSIWDTDLNVNGKYTTKTSLASLISDETATNRRTVECLLNLSDKLRNPLLGFQVNVPDLNPATQALVDGALNTEDKVQKQFLALLVTGNFLPEDDTGITTTGTSTMFSGVTGLMAGQINTIFQKLNIPVDVGLDYRSTDAGNDLFDVALSTQLFNNRVIVNGNIGNKEQYGMSTNEVAGDVDVEIKVNRSGSLRLNLFSHSADQFTSYLDNSQRSGAGVAYQREFNTFRELAHEVFTPLSRRRQEAVEALLNPTGSIVLQVDTTGRTTIRR